jgi:hypothetical protein
MAGRRSSIRWYIMGFALLLAAGSAYYLSTRFAALRAEIESHDITTSAPPGGSYKQALDVLFQNVRTAGPNLGFRLQLHDTPSTGELETLCQIRRGEVDIGLIQGDVVINSEETCADVAGAPQVYALAKMYDEVFVFFTRRDVATLAEFCADQRASGTPVRTGSLGDGSQVLVDLINLLHFYRCPVDEAAMLRMSYSEAAQALNAGEIDIAFMVAGYRNPVVRELASTEGVSLLALTEVEALTRNFGGIQSYTVPPGLFGSGAPQVEVQTVSTPAVLVISERVGRAAAYDLADFIFSHQAQLETHFPQFDIALPVEQTGAPTHPASLRAHDQRDLTWFDRNGALIQSILSIIGVLTGVATVLFQVFKFIHDAREDAREQRAT